jgi:hypothetical protein
VKSHPKDQEAARGNRFQWTSTLKDTLVPKGHALPTSRQLRAQKQRRSRH